MTAHAPAVVHLDHSKESTISDLARAFDALKRKQAECERRQAYYAGDHPLVYMNAKLQRVFKKLDARWSQNYCGIVVDSLVDRVKLTGFHYCGPDAPTDPQAEPHPIQQALDDWWDDQDVAGDADEIVKSVAVQSEGFYLAEESDKDIVTVANGAHLCEVFYSERNPKVAEFAAKWWDDGDHARLTLYYPDRLDHYVAGKKRKDITTADAFTPDPETPTEKNTYKAIPLFHFRKSRDGEARLDESTIQMNNAINKLFADMMVAAEAGAFKQRYIISQIDVTEAAKSMRAGASEVAMVPGASSEEGGKTQDTEVGQFEETPLSNYIVALEYIAFYIAIRKHLPKHYLLKQGDVSGEALIAMESGLVKEASSYQSRLDVTWKRVGAFVASLKTGDKVPFKYIEPVWEEEATVQPYTEALIIQALAKAGLPVTTIMRMVKGWSDEEVAEMLADADAEEARGASMGQAALAAAQKRYDSGEGTNPYPEPAEDAA